VHIIIFADAELDLFCLYNTEQHNALDYSNGILQESLFWDAEHVTARSKKQERTLLESSSDHHDWVPGSNLFP
jgi:hypothetical protein